MEASPSGFFNRPHEITATVPSRWGRLPSRLCAEVIRLAGGCRSSAGEIAAERMPQGTAGALREGRDTAPPARRSHEQQRGFGYAFDGNRRFAAAGVFVASTAASAAPSPLPLLRPPGAGTPERFAARCVRCGRCLEACPYQAIHAAPLNAGREASTPYVNARAQACRLCVEFPCAAVCPTGALEVPAERRGAGMGVAVINEDTCLSFQGMRCEVCYRACLLIDEAITIDYRRARATTSTRCSRPRWCRMCARGAACASSAVR